MLPPLTRDGRLLLAACAVRSFAYGFLAVVLGLYLDERGLSKAAIGAVFTTALVGGAVATVLVTMVVDRFGRRRMLALGAVLMAAAGIVFALTTDPILLAVAAVLGTVSPSGKEVGPFLSLEQAAMPQAVPDAHRTAAFAAYNVVASLAGALGALAAGLPERLGMTPEEGHRALLWAYAGSSALKLLLYARLSPAIEAPPAPAGAPARARGGLHRSRGVVLRLSALFGLDAFAGGFVIQSLVALWFHERFGMGTKELASLFFAANVLAGLSFLAAAPVARRIGLVNTMVWTHLPSNLLLMAVPLMPTAGSATAVLLARFLLSQLDVPTRQSYLMAIVDPDERPAAAGLTSAVRNIAASLGPTAAAWLPAAPALGLPFLVAGGLKIVYDLALFASFRRTKAPEERGA